MSILWSKKINFTVKPSLERITLSKIAVSLWNWEVSTVSGIDFKASEQAIGRKWQEIEDKVLGKVPQLPLPQPFKEKVLCLIKPIGLEILKWIRYHLRNCHLDGILPTDLCWTPQGTIDTLETAKLLTEDENLDITKRYRLACVYCLEDKILQLWERIPDSLRTLKNFTIGSEIVTFWTYYIHGEMGTKYNFQEMCRLALLNKAESKKYVNKAAFEYFFSKLSPTKKDELISTFVLTLDSNWFFSPQDHNNDHGKYYYFDFLCFLLPLMTEKQQTKYFKKYCFNVLSYFLDWPWQSLFMEMVSCLQDFLSENDYNHLIIRIINKIKITGFMDYDYQKLFIEFWKQSPEAVKRYSMQLECVRRILLTNIPEIKDEADIKLILEHVSLTIGFMDYDYQKFFIEFWKQIPEAVKRYSMQLECVRRILLTNIPEIKDEADIKLILKHVSLTEKKRFIFGSHGIFMCKTLINNNEWSILEFFIRECKITKIEMTKYKEKLTACTCTSFQFTENPEEKWGKLIQLLDDNTYEKDEKKKATEDESSSAKSLHSIESGVLACETVGEN